MSNKLINYMVEEVCRLESIVQGKAQNQNSSSSIPNLPNNGSLPTNFQSMQLQLPWNFQDPWEGENPKVECYQWRRKPYQT